MLTTVIDPGALITTRVSWHTLAERVLAPARHAATGRIGLTPTTGGFATPEFSSPDFSSRTLAVVGADLVATNASGTTQHPITTFGDAARVAGVDPGAETGVYTPTTDPDTGRPLVIDPIAAELLADWFAFGERVLTEWSHHYEPTSPPPTGPSEIQLWPEHFDLALDLGPATGRANYGASPGDADHAAPYLYVGPWTVTEDPFWQGAAYATLGIAEIAGATDPDSVALDFFARGYAAATRP